MPPPCGSSINDWTLPSLVGTYIDLLLALLFLIGSTLVFLGSSLLSLLGLSLPCPCDGLFGCPNCVHARIGSVSRSIRTRFPCENVAFTGYGPDSPHAPAIELPGRDGAVVAGRRPVTGQVRRRRRGRSSWGAGCLSLTGEGVSDNFAAVVVAREEEETNDAVVSGIHDECVSLVDETAPAIECHSHATEEASSGVRDVYISKGKETTIVHNLEGELKDAQAAYSTLCLELEKERSAAATAADEAMAMILRLQSEKATMEMESSQYRRMIEEKFAYDEEEMEILKEIIVRREKEKHVLEKEVETYRQMISGEMTVKKHDPSLDCSDDPTKLLKTIYESIRKKEKLDGKMRSADDGEGIHQLEFTDPRDEFNLEVQEKGMLTMEIYPSCGQCKSSSIGEDDVRFDSNKFQELGFCKDNSCSILGEDAEKDGKIEVGIPVENLDAEDRQDGDMRDSNSSYFETDSNVLDVHVIDDGQNLADVRIGKASGASQTGNLLSCLGKVVSQMNRLIPVSLLHQLRFQLQALQGLEETFEEVAQTCQKGARCWIPQVTEFLSIYGGVPCLQLITRALHLQLKSRSYGKGSRPSSKVEKL
ncbi:Uncharacterized protein M6B38_112355 [Iris pallida]|uniref:GTD-binding domain-containing protein n=1 Tax=Iris pallida TaxID=29817 RepID=A0AAX6DMP4_IRIPA|nr:Uncharacterized protein M6B38_112355 [Iris pallida]